MAARSIGSGTISFGLVSIPFKLYTAASSQNVSFNLLHKKCGGRMKQQYFCPVDNCIVERSEMVKGFEFAKEQFVQFAEDELKKLESPKTDSLELVEFVPESTVDFVHIEKSYYIGPDKGGDRAYQLLSKSMQRTGRVAVGRYWTRGKEQLVLIRPYRSKGLILHYVYYSNEVRAFDEIELGSEAAFKPVEEQLADKLIEQLAKPEFDAKAFKDDYQERVKSAVEAKVSGQEIVVAQEAPKAQIIDLFEALKRSLDQSANASAGDASPASERPPPKKAKPRGKDDKKTQTG
jgi:DNA end-binding protein Ku